MLLHQTCRALIAHLIWGLPTPGTPARMIFNCNCHVALCISWLVWSFISCQTCNLSVQLTSYQHLSADFCHWFLEITLAMLLCISENMLILKCAHPRAPPHKSLLTFEGSSAAIVLVTMHASSRMCAEFIKEPTYQIVILKFVLLWAWTTSPYSGVHFKEHLVLNWVLSKSLDTLSVLIQEPV